MIITTTTTTTSIDKAHMVVTAIYPTPIGVPAMPSAPAGSSTQRVSLKHILMAAQISSVFTVTMPSTSWLLIYSRQQNKCKIFVYPSTQPALIFIEAKYLTQFWQCMRKFTQIPLNQDM